MTTEVRTISDRVTPLDEIEIKQIDEYPANTSVLLHGPPGTGKTTTAAARVATLIRDYGYEINDVAWATYRRTLADETLERLAAWRLISDEEMEHPKEGATRWISTTHAIANRSVGGLPDAVEEWHKRAFCNLQDLQYGASMPWGSSPGEELFDAFGWLVANCYDPGNPADLAAYPKLDVLRDEFAGDVGDMWAAWNDYKQAEDRIDFHEQLQQALAQQAGPGTPILIVDEYHDATPFMARVSEMWMRQAEIVIVAGDPHQVINSYQGASPYFFERLEANYPKILLDKTWRLGDVQWRASATQLAPAHNPPKVETTGTGDIREYDSQWFEHSRSSGEWITPATTDPASPGALIERWGDDMMFVSRTRKQAAGIGAALEKVGVFYTSQKELDGWNTENGATRLVLYNALTKLCGVTPDDFDSVNAGLGQFGGGSTAVEDITLTDTETVALLRHTRAEHLSQTRQETREHCDKIEDTGETITLVEIDGLVEPTFWGTYTYGAASERRLLKGDLGGKRERRALRKALSANSEPVDPSDVSVEVMTIHGAKGHEAANVVVYDGVTKTIQREVETDEEAWRNECRVWYVALSRAFERIHVVHDAFDWTIPWLGTGLRENILDTGRADAEEVLSDD